MLRLNPAHSSLSELFSDFELIFLNPDIDVSKRSENNRFEIRVSVILLRLRAALRTSIS
jgi:hypothetical protein